MIESQEPNRRNVNCVRKRTKEIEKVTCCPSAAVLPFFCTLMPTINTYLCHKKRLRLFFVPSITDSGRAVKILRFALLQERLSGGSLRILM